MALTKKQHYYVIAGSTLGHIALLLAFANISLDKIAQEFKNSDETERRNSPARVSMEQLPNHAAPFSAPLAQSEISNPQPSLITPQSDNEESLPAESSSLAEFETTNQKNEIVSPVTESSEPHLHDEVQSSESIIPENPQRKGDAKPLLSKKKRKISGAAFMSAFQNSRAFNNEIESNSQNARQGNSGSNNGTIPSHVQERLAIWRDLNFREKIRYALLKQACSTRKIVYGPVKISFSTIIDIDSEGRLITMPHVNTGSHDVNEYLTEMLKNADFPPIPQRLNRIDWQEPFSFELNLQAGHNTSELYLSQGANPNPPLRIY